MNYKETIKLLNTIYHKTDISVLDKLYIKDNTIRIATGTIDIFVNIPDTFDKPFLIDFESFKALCSNNDTALTLVGDNLSNGKFYVDIDYNINDFPIPIENKLNDITEYKKHETIGTYKINNSIIKPLLKFVCKDKLRLQHNGIMFVNEYITATDTYILKYVKHNNKNYEHRITLDGDLNKLFNTLDDITLDFIFNKYYNIRGLDDVTSVKITNSHSDWYVVSKLTYNAPNINSVLPSNYMHAIVLNNNILKEQIKIIDKIKILKNVTFTLDIPNNKLHLYSKDDKEENSINYKSSIDMLSYQKGDSKDYTPNLSIKFNIKLLLTILNQCNSPVRLELTDNKTCMKIDNEFILIPKQ